jgi:micrococcal nuclease
MTSLINAVAAVPKPNWVYSAALVKVIDGDTLQLSVDQGFENSVRIHVRLYGINTPETYGVKKDSAEYKAGMSAKTFTTHWLLDAQGEITIISYDAKKLKTEKYGRWLAVLYRNNDVISLNDALVNANLAAVISY